MAELIRKEHQLLTVRLDLKPSRSGRFVECVAFRGKEALGDLRIAAEQIGIRPQLRVRDYFSAEFQFPQAERERLGEWLKPLRRDEHEPIWLQVNQSTGHLAVVPWERLLQEEFGSPLLRIPNFLTAPVYAQGPPEIVVCVSSPRAKTAFDVPRYTQELIAAIHEFVPQPTVIHVFADQAAFHPLEDHFQQVQGPHEVTVYDPQGAEPFGEGITNRNLTSALDTHSRLQSPWLLWMRQELSGRNVDAVHFLCPGYFSRDNGALALARSPLLNVDPEWSHFIGIEELIRFLDLLGAWSVAFSPPYENVWSIGLRLLADQLAWRRPGPLLIHDTGSHELKPLGEAYRFLYAAESYDPPASPSVMLYCHPQRLAREDEAPEEFEQIRSLGIPQDARAWARSVTRRPARSESAASAPEPVWKQANQLMLDQLMLRLEDQNPAQQAGTMEAVDMLNSLFRGDEGGAGRGAEPMGGGEA